MWNYCYKIASIHGWSIGITHRSVKVATYTPKAYYGDDICFKEKDNQNLPIIKPISEHYIKPKHEVEESKRYYHLAPHDLVLLPLQTIQFGLMFTKPSHKNNQDYFSMQSFIQSLKKSLSLTLVHFHPLAGQLVTEVDKDKHQSLVYVDCNKGPGARFIHATLDMNIYDILSPKDVPLELVQSFFDLDEEVVSYDGRSRYIFRYPISLTPLLSVQVTELLDGIFIACSVNHCITDGTSYWQFWSIWSEIHRENHKICESRLPVYTRWYPDGRAPGPYPIPYTHPHEFVKKFEPPQLSDRIFHFSSESIARLKVIANEEGDGKNISSFQALCALVWRSIVRANRVPDDQVVYNKIVANSRERIDPPLPKYYFGNFVQHLTSSTTAGELLENNIGWAASLLHQSVVNLNDKTVRGFVDEWLKSPYFCNHAELHNCNCITVGNSPRFDIYGNEFGLGKAVAFRSGLGNKDIGLVYACQGCKGGGSVDIEIYLPSDSMNALEFDKEFMAFVSMPL